MRGTEAGGAASGVMLPCVMFPWVPTSRDDPASSQVAAAHEQTRSVSLTERTHIIFI